MACRGRPGRSVGEALHGTTKCATAHSRWAMSSKAASKNFCKSASSVSARFARRDSRAASRSMALRRPEDTGTPVLYRPVCKMRSTASCLIARYKVERCTPNLAAIAFTVYPPRSISSQADATCADVRTRRECPFMHAFSRFPFIPSYATATAPGEKHDVLTYTVVSSGKRRFPCEDAGCIESAGPRGRCGAPQSHRSLRRHRGPGPFAVGNWCSGLAFRRLPIRNP